MRAELLLDDRELQAELRRMTDHRTDLLFAQPDTVATTIAFPVSRLVVDPERFVDDATEVMATRGMGVIYTRTSHGKPLRGEPSPARRTELLRRFYHPHHVRLTAAVAATLGEHGHCLVVDGHSFPSIPLPYELDQDPARPDICIGTDSAHTPTWLRDLAVEVFDACGLSVAVDHPFSGALVPGRYLEQDRRVLAVMVEVNRRLYMDESTGSMSPHFQSLGARIRGATQELIATASC